MSKKPPGRHLQFIPYTGIGKDHGFSLKQNRRSLDGTTGHADLPVPDGDFLKYGQTQEVYLNTGERDAEFLRAALVKQGIDAEKGPGNILEFGCANARVLRWFQDWSQHGEAWGVDLSAPMVFWCHQNLSPPFHFAVSTTSPSLFFEDRFFSLIFAMSIFTHIDDMYLSWIAELRRITAVGGFVYLTINDENTRKIQEERGARSIKRRQKSEAFQEFIENDADFCSSGRDWDSMISFKRSYFIDHVSRYFEVVDVVEGAMARAQTGVLLKRI